MADTPRIEPAEGERPGFWVKGAYRVKDLLKASIPRSDRFWNDNEKAWWVSRNYNRFVHVLLLEHYGGYEVTDRSTGELTFVDRTGSRASQPELPL